AHGLSEACFGESPETFFYLKTVDGRRSVVRQEAGSGLAVSVTSEPAPKGGVGYGGGSFAVRGKALVYAAKDGRLYAVELSTGEERAITPAYEGVAAPQISPCGTFVAFLCEEGGRCNVLLVER